MHLKTIKYLYITFSILSMALGCWLMVYPYVALQTISNLAGLFFLVFGIIKIISYFSKDIYQLAFQFDFGIGIISIIVACILFFKSSELLNALPKVIGLFILLDSAFKLQIAFDSKRFGIEKWWFIILIAIVTAILGVCLTFLSIDTMKAIIRLIGVNFCLDGLLNLFVVTKTVSHIRRKEYE